MSLLEKIRKNSTIKETSVLSKSVLLMDKELITTSIPALNIALSGDISGGFSSGILSIGGISKNFKTGISLVLAKSYMDKYSDSVLLFYDGEFGSPKSYFNSFGIDMDRVIHTPIMDIEELKSDIVNQLNVLSRGDKLIIIIDSIGNLASKTELNNAMDGKTTVDLTRNRSLKSLFRMVTPILKVKDIPLIVITHTYSTLELYSQEIVSMGRGGVYSSDLIFIITRRQEKEGTDLVGYNFVINVDKSRFVKEKSKIPISVTYEHGISKYSGLIEIAEEAGYVVKPVKGWYSKVNKDTGEIEEKKYRFKDTNTKEFWDSLLSNTGFQEWIRHRYQIGSGYILESEEDTTDDTM